MENHGKIMEIRGKLLENKGELADINKKKQNNTVRFELKKRRQLWTHEYIDLWYDGSVEVWASASQQRHKRIE